MNIYAAPGTKVRFQAKHGSEFDQAFSRKHLTVGAVYTVSEVSIHAFYSSVYLMELPGIPFNSVLFEDGPASAAP